jgi:hypothetical protein
VRPLEKSVHGFRNLDGFCQAVPVPAGGDSKGREVAKADGGEAVLLVPAAKLRVRRA